jgi:hypothetical protein
VPSPCEGLFERNIKLLHRSQRFAQFAAQLRCRLTQRVQHVLLGRHRNLVLGQCVSVLTIHCFQFQYILAPQTADSSRNVSLAAHSLAKLADHLGRELRIGWTGHLLQGLRHVSVGEHIQKRRLPQGNVERRLQSIVENSIASAVGKIGENEGVLFCQSLALLMRAVVEAGGDDRSERNGSENPAQPHSA